MAEPLILLTGVVLWRLCRLYKKTKMYKNRRKIAATTLHKRAARAKIDFCAPGRDLASILAAPERSRVLPDAPPGVPGRSWGPSGRSRGTPRALRDASKTLPECLPNAIGQHGASREAPGSDFPLILDAPGTPLGAIVHDFGVDFHNDSCPHRVAFANNFWGFTRFRDTR